MLEGSGCQKAGVVRRLSWQQVQGGHRSKVLKGFRLSRGVMKHGKEMLSKGRVGETEREKDRTREERKRKKEGANIHTRTRINAAAKTRKRNRRRPLH